MKKSRFNDSQIMAVKLPLLGPQRFRVFLPFIELPSILSVSIYPMSHGA